MINRKYTVLKYLLPAELLLITNEKRVHTISYWTHVYPREHNTTVSLTKMYNLNLIMKKRHTLWIEGHSRRSPAYRLQKCPCYMSQKQRNSLKLKESKKDVASNCSMWFCTEPVSYKKHYWDNWQNLNVVWGLDNSNILILVAAYLFVRNTH